MPTNPLSSTYSRQTLDKENASFRVEQKSHPEDKRLPSRGIYRILICRPNHRLGNLLLLTPLLQAIEAAYPGAEVDLLVGSPCGHAIFSRYPQVRHIHALGARIVRHPLRLVRILLHLRARRYDLVIDAAKGSGSGRIFSRIIRGRYSVSPSDLPESTLTEHFAHRPVAALAAALGSSSLKRPYANLDLRLAPAEIDAGRSALERVCAQTPGQAAPVIGIFANATGKKNLDKAWWKELIAHLKVMAPECQLVEFLPAHGMSMLDDEIPGLFSTDLRNMAAAMCHVDIFISGDCGVMHLASAARARTLGLFSVTSMEIYGPFGNGSQSLDIRKNDPKSVASIAIKQCDL
ncbi:glycosyltransferase family 9 protein [Oleiagrimonas sp. C23AA]|uniref:glycosyltransferase family 9 protein n=1 Tax=Oleiagrimonas sp. C23AA TaxID=2719047 RepID=UPI0014240527|nr:glycosyltransferase family 9 protein [Oleiagrimonas sp. C23AA]NII11112.1 glycosyltransferase family 9 protein [Oleiagrimonas sp. C23AA]